MYILPFCYCHQQCIMISPVWAAHCLDLEQYFVKRRSNLDGPSSNYIWFGEKQILYTDHWIISDLDVYSTDVSSILRLEKESVAIYVTILTRILKWKWRVHPDCSCELRYGAPPVKTVTETLLPLLKFCYSTNILKTDVWYYCCCGLKRA